MSDFFSSALNYFTGGSDGGASSRFVGQVVDLGGGDKLKVKKVIAEGKMCVLESEDLMKTLVYILPVEVIATRNKQIALLRLFIV